MARDLLDAVLDITSDGGAPAPQDSGFSARLAAMPQDTFVPSGEGRAGHAGLWSKMLSPQAGSYSIAAPEDSVAKVNRILGWTNLDIGMLAATLGVTRRSVHLWRSGGNIGPESAARISALASELEQLRQPFESADAFRLRLIATTDDSPSQLARIRTRIVSTDARRNAPSPRSLLTSDEVSNSKSLAIVASNGELPARYVD